MHSEFSIFCRKARNAITIPAVPLAAIRTAVLQRPQTSPKRRRTALLAAIFSAVSIAAAAAVNESHIWFLPNGGIVLSGKATPVRDPSTKQMEDAARALSFGAVLPAGLPAGTTLRSMVAYGTDAMALQYDLPGAERRSNHVLWIVLAGSRPGDALSRISHREFERVSKGRLETFWRTGNERVYLDAPATMTAEEIDAMKSAMGGH